MFILFLIAVFAVIAYVGPYAAGVDVHALLGELRAKVQSFLARVKVYFD